MVLLQESGYTSYAEVLAVPAENIGENTIRDANWTACFHGLIYLGVGYVVDGSEAPQMRPKTPLGPSPADAIGVVLRR